MWKYNELVLTNHGALFSEHFEIEHVFSTNDSARYVQALFIKYIDFIPGNDEKVA